MRKHSFLVLVLVAASCSTGYVDATTSSTMVEEFTSLTTTSTVVEEATTASVTAGESECAHVIAVSIERNGDSFDVSATVSSGDTGWDKYADAWQVWGQNGDVLAERVLTHPHETEQPFTRSLSGVELPAGTTEVTIAAHDLVAGFCGDVLTVEVPTS